MEQINECCEGLFQVALGNDGVMEHFFTILYYHDPERNTATTALVS